MNVGELRQDYRVGELHRADLAEDPFVQFGLWFAEALASPAIGEANAMTLATAGRSGQIGARTVLLKSWDPQGFVFFTNYESLKGRQIAENPQVALLFPWLPLERQISITGTAEKVSEDESREYFLSRPLASRLGAWASRQSEVLPSREPLEERYTSLAAQHVDGEVPLPPHWGGYRVIPASIEFWQGRTSRLHDRFLYTRLSDGSWQIDRLSP